MLVIARSYGEEHVAFAMIRFSSHAVASWEPAWLTTKTTDGLDDHCYSVDSGCGGFCDGDALVSCS
jgi:hypothetical protein